MARRLAASSPALRFAALTLLCFAVRLYRIDAPLTDGGHERQTLVAMIARNFYRENMNLLLPRLDTFAPDPGYVMLEFPLQPALMAAAYHVTGVQDSVGRLVAVFFSVGSIAYFWGIARRMMSERAALGATGMYALTPLSIFFGRVVFPEPLFMCFSLGSMYYLLRWMEARGRRSSQVWISAVLAAVAILVKPPPGIVMLLPLSAVYWLTSRQRWRSAQVGVQWFAFCAICALPILLWARWSATHTASLDAGWSPYRLSAMQRWGIPHAWVDPAMHVFFWRSMVLVALTPVGTVLATVGLWAARRSSTRLVLYAWVAAMAAYVIATPGAQGTHWNYQVPLVALGALLAGVGGEALARSRLVRRNVQLFFIRPAWQRAWVGGGVMALAAHLAIYGAVARDAYDTHKRDPHLFQVTDIVRREIPPTGFVLLMEPKVGAETMGYYMDRRVRFFETLEAFRTPEEAMTWVRNWQALGATALVAVDTPYASGTALIRQSPALMAYLNEHARQVADTPKYLVYAFD